MGIGAQIQGTTVKNREESHPSHSLRLWWRPGLWLERVQHHLVATQTWEDITKCSLSELPPRVGTEVGWVSLQPQATYSHLLGPSRGAWGVGGHLMEGGRKGAHAQPSTRRTRPRACPPSAHRIPARFPQSWASSHCSRAHFKVSHHIY